MRLKRPAPIDRLRRIRSWLKLRPFTTAMLTTSLIVSPGYVALERQADRIEDESLARSVDNCKTLNDVKQLIVEILALFENAQEAEPEPEPITEDEMAQRVRLLQRLSLLLAKADCDDLGDAALAAKATLSVLRADMAADR